MDGEHVLIRSILISVIAGVDMLMKRYVLHMIVILFLTTQRQLCALIQLICISFSWNIHHYQVFADIIEIWAGIFLLVLVLVKVVGSRIHAQITAIMLLPCHRCSSVVASARQHIACVHG